MEMTNKESVQKVRFEGKVEEKKGEKGHRMGIQYTRVDVPNQPSGKTAFKLASQWTADEKNLMAGLNPGDEVVMTKVEQKYKDSTGVERTAWPIKSVADVSTWVDKPKKQWNNNKSTGGYDSLGNQVGNCVTNAIASLGAGKTIEQYKARMMELAEAGNWLRNMLENQQNTNNVNNVSNNNVQEKAAKPAPVESVSAVEDNWDSIEESMDKW